MRNRDTVHNVTKEVDEDVQMLWFKQSDILCYISLQATFWGVKSTANKIKWYIFIEREGFCSFSRLMGEGLTSYKRSHSLCRYTLIKTVCFQLWFHATFHSTRLFLKCYICFKWNKMKPKWNIFVERKDFACFVGNGWSCTFLRNSRVCFADALIKTVCVWMAWNISLQASF